MKDSVRQVWQIVVTHGFVARREHPDLLHTIQWLVRTDKLLALFPGVYVDPERRHDTDLRIRAAQAWHPDAVLLGAAAIRCTWDPHWPVDEIVLACPGKRVAPPGVRLVRWRVPPEHIRTVNGLQMTAPALTALEVVPSLGGAQIDEVLRLGLADLSQLWEALAATAHRRGNPYRRMMLIDSRDEPWSEAERELHRILRAAGITGWTANTLVLLEDGTWVTPDVTFEAERACIEVDGYSHHRAELRHQFEYDRWKGTELSTDQWTVVRVTYRQITERPDWVIAKVRRALAPAADHQRPTTRCA